MFNKFIVMSYNDKTVLLKVALFLEQSIIFISADLTVPR